MKNNDAFYLFCRFMLFLFFSVFFRFRTTGGGKIPRTGGGIIASNHLSYLDPIILSIGSPRILSFMAKRELFEGNGFFSWLIRALNAFPIERDKADLKAIRVAIDKLKNQSATMIIFPEGTRSLTGEIGPAQSGMGMLAAKSGAWVVPALIIGTNAALPSHSKKLKFFEKIEVHFGDPVYFSQVYPESGTKENYQSFSDLVVEGIKKIKISLSR